MRDKNEKKKISSLLYSSERSFKYGKMIMMMMKKNKNKNKKKKIFMMLICPYLACH